MAERLYVGTPTDCNAVRSALDFAMNMPEPGTVNGVPIVDEQTRQTMFAAWWAMPQASRDALCANPVAPWIGWTLQWTTLDAEPAPGTRHACWVPDNIPAVMQASSAAGRTLSIDQITALNAAALSSLAAHPANWVFPEP
jgi:hypothetical protein